MQSEILEASHHSEVGCFLQVGDDEFGYMLCDVLKDQKVETKGIRFDSHARTALAFVTLRADGEREFMFYRNPSADMLFEIPELDTDLLKQVLLTYIIVTDCARCKFGVCTVLLACFHFQKGVRFVEKYHRDEG